MRAILIIFLFLLLGSGSKAQEDFAWWNTVNNWDGFTAWNQYITMSPGFMGPNALPVPEVQTGRLDPDPTIRIRAQQFLSEGEYTISFPARFHYPFSDRIAIQLFGVPFEYYKTDTVTRDKRGARGKRAEGVAAGDLYFGTIVQILKDHKFWPDLSLEMVGKTASGTNFDNARFTDSPGYYFDLGFGRKFRVRGDHYWAWFGMLGFYSWQTQLEDHRQDDAFLWGGGLMYSGEKYEMKVSTGGYSGYLLGDNPIVSRLYISKKGKRWNQGGGCQIGWQDQPTFAIEYGWEYKLNIDTK